MKEHNLRRIVVSIIVCWEGTAVGCIIWTLGCIQQLQSEKPKQWLHHRPNSYIQLGVVVYSESD